jgi:hypothetical protein
MTKNPVIEIEFSGAIAPKQSDEPSDGSGEAKARPDRRLTMESYHAAVIALEAQKGSFAAPKDSGDSENQELDEEDLFVLDAVSRAAISLQMGFVRKVRAVFEERCAVVMVSWVRRRSWPFSSFKSG